MQCDNSPNDDAANSTCLSGWRRWLGRVGAVLLSSILFVASLSLYNTHTNFPVYWHPDEATKVNQIVSDQRNYNHPQLLLEMTLQRLHWQKAEVNAQTALAAGRWSSAFFAAVVVWAFAWAGYAHGGLIGMLLVSLVVGLCPPLVTYAHYMKEDPALAAGVALSALAMAAFTGAGRWWTQLGAVIFMGFACGVAASGKYVGAISGVLFVYILLGRWRHWTMGILWPIFFCASLCATAVVINYRAITPGQALHFEQSLVREGEHSLTEHLGLTMDQPNSFFIDTVWQQSQWSVKLLIAVYLAALVIRWRELNAWKVGILLYAVFWLAVLSFGVIYFPRYALPTILLFYAIAGLGAYELVRWAAARGQLWRWCALVGMIALIAGVQGPRVAAYTRQFDVANDTRMQLVDWMREHLSRRDSVVAENYAGLRMGQVPARLRVVQGAADMGSIDRLRRMGVGYVVVADIWYNRFFIPQVKPAPGREAWFKQTQAFYEDLFAHYPMVWHAAPSVNQQAYTSPEIRVYRIAAERDATAR